VDQSLFAVSMEARLHGTSTRKVDGLVKALGADTGISKAERVANRPVVHEGIVVGEVSDGVL
jgi:hypothetical protein